MGLDALMCFVASFRDGTPPLYVPADALRVLRVLDAVQESSRAGRLVDLTPAAL
jgi:hypothetical protein